MSGKVSGGAAASASAGKIAAGNKGGWAGKMMAKVKKVLPFNSKSKGETTVGGVQPGKTTRMQNELQEQYARAIQDGTVVQATQSWSTQPPGVYPPDPPRAAQQPGQKGVGAAKPKRDMNRKESANSMQLELMQMHQDNIKAGYIVPAVRGPSVSYVPTVVNKHAAAQLELQALYLDSLKQGSIIQARAPSQYYGAVPVTLVPVPIPLSAQQTALNLATYNQQMELQQQFQSCLQSGNVVPAKW